METSQHALVVVESHFGNTVAVADAVAGALRTDGVRTTVWMAHEAPIEIPADTTIILLVAPTHDGTLSTPATRRRAAGAGAKDSTDSSGAREWITQCTGGRDTRFITFATSEATREAGTHVTAADVAAELARQHGFTRVEQGPSFAVTGVAGPLAPGELRRARRWAERLGSGLVSRRALLRDLEGQEVPTGSEARESRGARPDAVVTERDRPAPLPDHIAGRRDDEPTHGDLEGRSAVELARLVAAREISARELVMQAIERVESRADLNVIAYDRFEEALAEADVPHQGPFAGVPLLLKDLGCDIRGLGSSMGSAVLKRAGVVASEDAELVRRLKAAGFIIIGRTTSPEFGISSSTESAAFGITRNPWRPDRSAGGSSGGSAAAVAASIVPLAQGSDGAGSLRMPAALCGVSALKPTHGRISQAPDWEVMMGHNDNGAVARHVVDLAGFLDVAEGHVPGDVAAHRVDGPGSHLSAVEGPSLPPVLRIGLCLNRSIGGVPVDSAVRDAVRVAGHHLADAGHVVDEACPEAYDEPELLDHFIDAIAPTLVDLLGGLGAMLGRSIDPATELEPVSQYWYERGSRRTAGDLAADLRWLGGYRRRLTAWWFQGWDVLVAPSFPRSWRPLGLPEDAGEQTRRNIDLVRATVPFNTSGQPAVTVPAVLTVDGPVGVQLVGAPGRDRLLLVLAAQLAARTGSAAWHPAGGDRRV